MSRDPLFVILCILSGLAIATASLLVVVSVLDYIEAVRAASPSGSSSVFSVTDPQRGLYRMHPALLAGSGA